MHLTVDAWVTATAAGGLSAAGLLAVLKSGPLGRLPIMALQLDDAVAMREQKVQLVAPSLALLLHRLSPLALALPAAACSSDGEGEGDGAKLGSKPLGVCDDNAEVCGLEARPEDAAAAATVWLQGDGLASQHVSLFCRANGSFQPLDMLASELWQGGSATGMLNGSDGDEEGGGDQLLVRLPLAGLRPGLAQWEAQWGTTLLSAALPQVLLPCAAAAAEVNSLRAAAAVGAAELTPLLQDIGLVVSYLHGGGAAAAHAPAQRAMVARAARRAVAAAVARRWPAATRLLLPGTTADGGGAAAALAAMDAQLHAGRGMTLLHAAVAAGSPGLLGALRSWGASCAGRAPSREMPALWRADARGAAGATPLHIAALLPGTAATAVLQQLTGGSRLREPAALLRRLPSRCLPCAASLPPSRLT